MPAHTQLSRPNTSDRPFGLPLITTVVDLPVPPSVNATRKVDWRSRTHVTGWIKRADALMLQQKARARPQKIVGRYELLVTLSEQHARADLDNILKSLIDYLRRVELVTNDSPKYLRRLVVEWCLPAVAPEGVRVTITELA